MKKRLLVTGMLVVSMLLLGGLGATQSNHVKRAQFTSAVVDREPVDALDSLSTDVDSVFFFTEIIDLAGDTLTHRWMYKGEVMAEVLFAIGGPRWRVHSSKNLMDDWVGTWAVEVLDGSGTTLQSDSLVYWAP